MDMNQIHHDLKSVIKASKLSPTFIVSNIPSPKFMRPVMMKRKNIVALRDLKTIQLLNEDR